MRYCTKCTMPDTRPGITFDEQGVCSACRHYENRKNVDWNARWKEFEALCDKDLKIVSKMFSEMAKALNYDGIGSDDYFAPAQRNSGGNQ